MKLILSLVDTLEKAQHMRVLRNEARYWMTGGTTEITEEQQEEFFRNRLVTGEIAALLLYEDDVPVAYALLRDGWMSCGVGEQYRGRGLGTLIVTAITAAGTMRWPEVKLEVWRDNVRAVRTYKRTGYRLVESSERDGRLVDTMEYP